MRCSIKAMFAAAAILTCSQHNAFSADSGGASFDPNAYTPNPVIQGLIAALVIVGIPPTSVEEAVAMVLTEAAAPEDVAPNPVAVITGIQALTAPLDVIKAIEQSNNKGRD